MSVHIKQLKGANDLIARDEFVRDNLQGKISLEEGNLVLSVPLKIEKTTEGEVPDFTQLEEDDIVTKKYVDESIASLKGEVSADYDTLKEIETKIKSISAATGVVPVSAQSESNVGTKIGSISVGDDTVNFYINLSNYVQKSGVNSAFDAAPTAPSISSAFNDNHLVTASFVHEVERNLIGVASDTLRTLSELADAINNDPDYYQTVNDALDSKLNKGDISIEPATTSGTLIGTIILDENTYELKADLSPLASLNSPNFTGTPTVPDVAKGDSSSVIANTRFVSTAVSDAVTSVKGAPPSNLDTLQKISTAIGDNPTFAANVNTSISGLNTTVTNLNSSAGATAASIAALDSGKQPLSSALTSISTLSTAADRMIYTTAKDDYAVTTLTGSARTLISKSTTADMRSYLEVPKADGTGAAGNWSITADKAVKDKNGNPIDTTYLKTADAVNVTVTNTVTSTNPTKLGTITIGDTAHDINVDLTPYAPIASPTFTGTPKSSTPTLTDNSTRIATTGFVQSVVSGAIDDLVGEGTPEALNTLKEIADVIGDNSDFTGAIITELGTKVSKVDGKGLSTNDYTTAEKDKLAGIAAGAEVNAINTVKVNNTALSVSGKAVNIDLSNYVQKDGSKVLSTNDFTNDNKTKLDGIATGAEVNKIETVKVNGTALPVTDKTVDITMPDISGKVDKVSGKGLSTNDYTTAEKTKLAGIDTGAQVNKVNTIKVNGAALTPDSNKAVDITVPDISGKVDKVTGKGLSTEDYTSAEKTKLSGIATGAEVNKIETVKVNNSALSISSKAVNIDLTGYVQKDGSKVLSTNDYTTAEKTKLSGIATGAQVNKIDTIVLNGATLTPDSNKVVNISTTSVDISGKVDKVEGKGLSTNDFTDGYKDKLDGVATGAQVNTIDTVKVNGTALSVSSKAVNIDLTGYVQKDGSKVLSTNDYTTAEQTKLAGIVDNATKDNVSLVAGASKATLNSAVTNPYINLTDNNVNKGSVQIKGDSAVTVSSSAAGVITVKSTDTTYNAGTGLSLSSGTFSADPAYLGSVQKSEGTTTYLRADGTWGTPPGTTYTAGTGIGINSGTISLKAATSSAIGGVKAAAVGTSNISLASDGSISVPLATTSQAGAVKVGTNLAVNNGTISLNSAGVTGALGFTPANSATIPAAAAVMTGASSSAAGKAGLVPAPDKNNQDKFLKGDGTWATPPDTNTTYSTVTTSTNGLVPTLPGDTTKFLRGDGAWNVPPNTNTTYSAGTGLSLSGTVFSANSTYLGSIAKGTSTVTFLRNDGSWATPPDTNTTYTAGNGLANSSNTFSVKAVTNGGLSVTSSGVSVTAANKSTFGGVKIGDGISTGAGGLISIPSASTSNAGLMTAAQVTALNGLAGATKNNVSLVAANTATGTLNATSTADNTFINLTDNNTVKGSVKIIGGGSVTVKSSTAGTIEISGTDTNTNTDEKVKQNISTTDNTFPVLLTGTANATGNVNASNVIFGSGVKVNPKTGTFVAPYVSVGTNLTAASISGNAVYYTTGTVIALDRSTDAARKKVMTVEALAYWNGAWNASDNHSNLAYCNLGAFGTAATTDASIYPSLAGTNSFSGKNTFTGRTYVKEKLIMSTGLAMSSVSTNKWDSAQDNYGQSYTPAGGVAWYHATNSATGVFGITSSSIGSTAYNLLLTSGESLILSAGEAPALNLLRAYGTPNSMYKAVGANGQMHLMSQYDIEFVTNASNSLDPSNIKRFVFYRSGNATIPGALTLGTPLSIANGGTGENDLANVSVGSAGKATLDGSGNTITTTYAKLASPTFTGTVKGAAVSLSGAITLGSALSTAYGGTGAAVNPSMLVNLGSTAAANVFAASPKPGITGTLGIANGGTGATTEAAARTALGLTAPALFKPTFRNATCTPDLNKPNYINFNNNNITVRDGLILSVRFSGFSGRDSIETEDAQRDLALYIGINNDNYGVVYRAGDNTVNLKVRECFNSTYYYFIRSGSSWLEIPSSYAGMIQGKVINGVRILDQYSANSVRVQLGAGQSVFITAGETFYNMYNTSTVNSIAADGKGENIELIADGKIIFRNNVSATVDASSCFDSTGLHLDKPLEISSGGTGGTNQTEALANLGISTVSADVALQAMGLGNGTGVYTCNISPTSATLSNDTLSPMNGFTLKDGVTVYFCLKNTVSAATKAMLSFNGTTAHSAYSIKSGVSTSTVPASVLTTGFYKAIYHTSALSSSDALTWIFHKIN